MNPNTARKIARIIAGLLAGLMILSLFLSLVGCGNATEEQPKEESSTHDTVAEKEEAELPKETPVSEEKVSAPEDEAMTENAEEPSEESEKEESPAAEQEETAPSEPQPELPTEPEVPDEPETPAESETPVAPSIISPDANGMMEVEGSWVQDPGALNSGSISNFARKLQSIRSNYLTGANTVAWSIIPDKSNYVRTRVSSSLNHADMVNAAKAGLSGWNYIEIGDLLTFDDYLLTDGHWRQERIIPVASKIAGVYGFSVTQNDYSRKNADGFGGDYAKYSGTTETISWLESAHTAATVCDNFQNSGRTAIYDSSLLRTNSPYDLFSGGPTPLVTLKNSAVDNGKKLILFRDSFGSSLAPLLLSGYSEIQLVDLRYMASGLLPQYVDAAGSDVLFLFSARVVNNSAMLR